MSFRDRLKRFFPQGYDAQQTDSSSANPGLPLLGIVDETEINGLNFRTAIDAHQKWKARLLAYLSNQSQEALDPQQISRDDQCVLGKWIHGQGQQAYQQVPRFAELRQMHAYFHQQAGSVVRLHQAGRNAEAQSLLENGAYSQASIKVCNLLAKLYIELQLGK